ncbi:MAG: P-II family nitrogen regulator [Poseidonibacter sp.]
MKKMKKMELIIESIYLNKLLDLFKERDITGYTVIKDIEGSGGHGIKMADQFSDIQSNNYIFTVCDNTKFEEIKEEIRAFTKRYGGKCIVSDALMLL